MIGRNDQANYYEILEVREDATQGEVYRAYQRAKATYSVDSPALYSMFTPEETRELLKLIEEAYSVLSNLSLRKNYDENLQTQKSTVQKKIEQFIKTEDIPEAKVVPDTSPVPAMPDLKYETIESNDEFIVRKADSKSKLPGGVGKTSLSTYKIDEALEAEIAAMDKFDGAALKRIRDYKGLTVERLSEATRISKAYLTAVEENAYSDLPAPVFVRGFIVQIARILSLDENKVANSYMQILKSR